MTDRSLRVLMISPALPYPPSWGFGSRVYQLARHLARRHEVSMLCFADPGREEEARCLGRELAGVHTVTLEQRSGIGGRRVAQMRSLLSPSPFIPTASQTAEMQVALDELTAMRRFDTIQVESVHMFGLRLPAGSPVVLDEHNIEYELLERMSASERSTARRMYNRVECVKLRRFEHRAWNAVDGCTLTSEREERIVNASAPRTLTGIVPNAVDVEFFAPDGTQREPDTLVFTGQLKYRPNVDAVHYLVDEILPLVRRERPACRLTIVGGGEADLLRLAAADVCFTGWVPDVRPYLAGASVAVAPIRMGSGTRLKVLEALAMATPVVSTTVGCEGLAVRPGEHLLVADSPEALAQHIVRLLAQRDYAQLLGERGAALARSTYCWDRSCGVLDDLHAEVVARRLERAS